MFTKAGDIKVKIIETCLAECKFENAAAVGGFDVCIKVEDVADPAQTDWWRGEFSPNFGQGKLSDRTQAQITLQSLERLGFEGGQDFSRLDELVGKETVAHIEVSADGKYHNLKWLGTGGNAPKKLDPAEAAKRMKAIMGGVATTAPSTTRAATEVLAATAPTATKPASAVKNPFL